MSLDVSVIIPAYKAEGCLRRAVASVLDQTLQNFEIIIIDDASPDGTFQLASDLAQSDPRISVYRRQINGGPSAARNDGFDRAKGKWIAILDADDVFLADRLMALTRIAEQNNLDVIADNILLHDGVADVITGKALAGIVETMLDVEMNFFLENDFSGNDFVTGSPYSYSLIQPVVRACFLNEHKIRYPVDYRHGEDSYFCTLLFIEGARVGLVPEAYYVYTSSTGAVSGAKSAFSCTNVDFYKKGLSCRKIIDLYSDRLAASTQRILVRRMHRNFHLHALALVKQGRWRDLVAFIRVCPSALCGGVALWIYRRVYKYFGKRS